MPDFDCSESEQLNWELAMAYLDEAIAELEECCQRIEKASGNLQELKEVI